MDFAIPIPHGHKYAHKGIPSKCMKLRTPQDLPWKILGTLVEGFSSYLSTSEVDQIRSCVRARSLDLLDEVEKCWSPQGQSCPSMLPADCSATTFAAKYQLMSLLKKYPFESGIQSRAAKALEKFQSAEATCGRYNSSRRGTLERVSENHPDLLGAIDHMRAFIEHVLPDYDPIELADELAKNGRHGPGSTLCTTKGYVTPFFKWSVLPYSVTQGARELAIQAIDSDPRWVGALQDWYRRKNGIPFHCGINLEDFWSQVLKVEPGNVITFVPKDRKVDRSIAIEPRMNLFLQLGMDHIIRTRLKRFGCNLDDQSKNQELARIGSITGKYATLDLSAASDTISLAIVEELFPPVWVDAMKTLRSPTGRFGRTQKPFAYEKLSSMGNGYTFVIESLIFLAVCYAALQCYKTTSGAQGSISLHDDVAVYGDDIVVPVALVSRLKDLLHYCGFTVNVEKSFESGPFRESCGKDYFSGHLVRPLFLREEIRDVQQAYAVINRCRAHHRLCRSCGFEDDDPYQGTREIIARYLPDWALLIVGPESDEEFDTYLHVPLKGSGAVRRNDLFSFFRIVKTPKSLKLGSRHNDFLFRKLMCLTRPADTRFMRDPSPTEFPDYKGARTGSVFTVSERGSLRYMLTEARTSFWF